MGGQVGNGGGGGGWETEGRLNHSWEQGQSHCVSSKTQKQPQCTCQAKTVAGSSLTAHAALLVHPSGTIWTIMNLQGQKMLPVKADLDIFSTVIGVSG